MPWGVYPGAGRRTLVTETENAYNGIESGKVLERKDLHMLPAAIFDMDGLMFDTEKLWSDALDQVVIRCGYEPDPAFNEACRGKSGDGVTENAAQFFPGISGINFWKEAMEIVRDTVRESVPVKEGLYEILEMFSSRGVKLAVATGSPIELASNNLRVAGIEKYFSSVISSIELELRSKPAPDVFLEAAKGLGFLPEECYVFEDSFNGIRAAAAAGACPIMIPDLDAPDDEMRRLASAIYKDLAQAADAIEKNG